ncbi:MAG: DNA methyltransferase [Candidatus Heimdallarchaeota archaeon]
MTKHKILNDFGVSKPEVDKLHLSYISVKNEKRHPIHSLHKWYGKLIPAIPRWAIREFSKPGDTVLDPFCGSGTTLIEAILNERKAVGIDIDPLACLISKVKTTPINTINTKESIHRVLQGAKEVEEVAHPDFPNLDYWFNPSVIKGLAKLLYLIKQETNKDIRDFLLVCFSSIIRKVSLADPKFLITARSKHREKIGQKLTEEGVFKRFADTCRVYLGYIRSLPSTIQHVEIHNADTRYFDYNNHYDLVVTNPPYVGAVDYVRAMRLERYWLELVAHDLSLQRVSMGYQRNSDIQYGPTNIEIIDAKLEKVKKKAKNAYRTLIAYFNDMELCFTRINQSLKDSSNIVIKIGDIKLGRTDIGLGEFLIALVEKMGWNLKFQIKDPIGGRSLFTKRYELTNPDMIEFDWIIGFER